MTTIIRIIIIIVTLALLSNCDNNDERDEIFKFEIDYDLIDYDGNGYDTIGIGDQVWMANNLKVTHYADGTPISLIEDSVNWANLDLDKKAYCYYDNSTKNGNVYGVLYTWATAMNGMSSSNKNPSGIQGVCPTGWHLPSDAEWKELEMFLGMSQEEADTIGLRGTSEGGKLKQGGTTHWLASEGVTNSSGFTALPGGRRYHYSDYAHFGCFGYWWSTTELDRPFAAITRILNCTSTKVYRNDFPKGMGHSVRCLKD